MQLRFQLRRLKNPLQNIDLQGVLLFYCGPDGTRTRDLRRDRAAF